jgi:hypothetical protein
MVVARSPPRLPPSSPVCAALVQPFATTLPLYVSGKAERQKYTDPGRATLV